MERFSWLRWVRSLRQPQTRTIVRSRDLRLERLEARETPATFIWTGAGLDNFWSNPSNWAGNVAPSGAPTDQLVFQSGANRLNNVNDLTNAVFASITISGSGYNITGNAITLGDETFGTSGAISVGAGVTSATLGLNIAYGAAANSTMPVAIGSGSTLAFTGQLSGTADKGLAKSGLGTLVLRNANPDWDGVININQGILQVENNDALGSTVGGTSVATTAQLRLAGNLTIAEPLTLNGPGQSNDGALLAFSGNSRVDGPILLDSNVTLGANANASMEIRGVISDAGAGYSIVKEGTGRVTLSAANTFRGQVTINNGTLAVTHAQALGFTDGTEATGTVVNSTSLRSGTLLLDPGEGQKIVFANEMLTLNGSGFGDQGALVALSGQVVWTGTVNLGGTSTSDVVITVEDDNTPYTPTATEALDSNFLLIGSGAPYGVAGDGLIQTPNGPRNWFKRGEGVMVLTNQNTYEGRTTVEAGILEVRDSNALGVGGSADNEIQILTVTGDNGTFTLSFGSENPTTSAPILVGPTLIATTTIRDALASLGAIADVANIQVTRAVPLTNTFRIQFRNALGGTDLSQVVAGDFTGNVAAAVTTEQDGNRNGTVVQEGATLALRVDTNLHPALIDSKTGTTNSLDLQESITISGNGVAGLGALRSIAGINKVSERVGLSGPAAIGVDADPNQVNNRNYLTQEYSLTIPGNLNGTAKLTKTGAGHLILPTANPFFRGDVDINSGWITVSDNESLGRLPPNVSQNQRPNVNIVAGAALHINPLNPGQSLNIQQNFSIAGQGFEHAFASINNKGAITSLNGVNYVSGNVRLSGEAGVGSVLIRPEDFPAGQLYLTGTLTQAPPTGGGALASTGDRREFARTFRIGPNGSFSIDVDVYTVSDNVRIYYGTRDSGDFVLVYDSDPNYRGANPGPFVASTNQFRARIDINFTPTSATVDVVSLKGKGFGGKFGGGGQFGKNWQYQDQGPQTIDYGRTVNADTIELVINEGDSNENRTQWQASVTFSGNEALGGLAKLGDQLVVIQGNGSYQGDVLVQEGVLLVQNDTALGLAPAGGQKRVSVAQGATLALGTTLPQLNGGRQSGLQTQNFKLELNGVGNNTLLRPIATDRNPVPVGQLAALEVWPDAFYVNGTGSVQYTTIVPSDYLWRGGVGLNATSALRIPENARLNILGSIDDASNPNSAGSHLVFIGGGELGLFGANSYRGITYVGTSTSDNPVLGGSSVGVNQHFTGSNTPLAGGTLTVAHSQALGTADGGTIVQEGSALHLEGNLTIAGEQLIVSGSGLTTLPSTPPAVWFQQGPAAQQNGPLMGSDTANIAGRITGVAVDRTDTDGKTIIVSTAGGGSWRTTDGGLTWQPTFDNIGNAPIFTGAIAIDPVNPNVVYLGTGEANNSNDSFAGTGVWRSTDGGKTWGNAPIGGFNNPLRGLSITRIIVDPISNNFVYVATSDTSPNASQSPTRQVGVYRANISGNSWTNLTAIVSDRRDSGNSVAYPDSTSTPGNRPPNNAGPDDDWRIFFPTRNVAYSDLGVSRERLPNGTSRTVLWMAVGAPDGDGPSNNQRVGRVGSTQENVFQRPANGVYFLRNPANYNEGGANDANGWKQAFMGYTKSSTTTPAADRDTQTEGIPNLFSSTAVTNNGTIKLSVQGTTLENTRVFAVVTDAQTKNYLEMYTGVFTFDNTSDPTNATLDWDAVGADPTEYMNALGHYASAVFYDGTRVFVGGHSGVFVSSDNGGNWTSLTGGSTTPPRNVRSIVDYEVTRDGTTRSGILVGSDGGLFFWDGTAWESLNGNMANALARSVGTIPSNANLLFTGTQAGGTARTNGSQVWDTVNATSTLTLGGQVRVNPNNTQIVYASLGNGPISNPGPSRAITWQMYRSTDGGTTWSTTSVGGAGLSGVFTLDNINADRVVISTPTGVLESLNSLASAPSNLGGPGGAAVAVSTYQGAYQFDPAFPLVSDLGASSYDSQTIYSSNGLGVGVTKNRGIDWVTRPLPGNLGNISGLAVDGRNRDTVFAVRNGYDNNGKVFFSTNAGRTWSDITNNLQDDGALAVWSVAVDSRNGRLYIGTDRGVFSADRTATGYSNWVRVGASAGGGTSLANVQVRDVVLNPAANTLTIATYGRGVYTIWLNEAQANAGAIRAVSGSSIWTGDVVLRGNTSIGADGTQEFRGVTAASLNIVGTIRDENPALPGDLVKIGGGTLTLSGANTYAGLTTIAEGVIVANNPNALGSPTQGTIVQDGAALQLINSVDAEPLTLFGNGPLAGFEGHFTGALENLANNNTYSGPITLGSDTTIGVGTATTLTLTGAIGDNGNNHDLTKEGTGTLVLRPLDGSTPTVNTYGGDTYINQGALRVEGDGALGSTGSATFVRNGAQLQVGAPTSSGGITINGETLHLSGTGISNTGALLNTTGNNVWNGNVVLDVIPGFAPFTNPVGVTSINVVRPQDTLTIAGNISEPSLMASGLRKVGSGTLALSGNNTYSGTTYVNVGAVRVESEQALGTANNNEIQRIVTTGTPSTPGDRFRLTVTNPLTNTTGTTGNINWDADAATVRSAIGALVDGVGNVQVTKSVVTTTVPDPTGVGTQTLTSNVFTVTFTGALAGLNVPQMTSFIPGAEGAPVNLPASGATAAVSTVADGGIGTRVASGAALQLDLADGTITGETLALNGNGLSGTGALNNLAGNNTWTGGITLESASSMGVANDSLTVSGVIAGAPTASLTKTGTGTAIFTAANTYAGNTTVAQGILNVRNSQALGTGATNEVQTVTLGGSIATTFQLRFGTGTGNTTAALPIATSTAADVQAALNGLATIGGVGGSVTVTKAGSTYTITFGGSLAGQNVPQLVVLPGTGATASVTTVQEGGLGITTVNNGATLQLQDNLTLAEPLFLNGNGVGGIGALDSASGNNTVNGPLTLASNSAIGAQTGSTLTLDTSIRQSASNTGLIKVGAGEVVMTGAANTYNGTTTVARGLLSLNKPSADGAILGNLVVGNGSGQAQVRLLADNQIANSSAVTVNAQGTLNNNDRSETIGALTIQGGTVLTGSDSNVNGSLTLASLNMTGGELNTGNTGDVVVLATGGGVTATANSSGPALIAGEGLFNLGSTARTFNVTDDGQAQADLVVAAPLQGTVDGSVTKSGNGLMRIDADLTSTLTNNILVQAGALQVDGATNGIRLTSATASVGGNGTVGRLIGAGTAVFPTGIVNPGDLGTGDKEGRLTIDVGSGTQTFGSTTTLFFDLTDVSAPGDPGGYDQIFVTGNVVLNAPSFRGTVSDQIAVGQTFTVITATGTLSYPSRPQFVFIGGNKFETSIVDGNKLVLTARETNTSIGLVANPTATVYGQSPGFTFTATLSSEAGAGALPSGAAVFFEVFAGNTATGTPIVTETIPVNAAGVAVYNPQLDANAVFNAGQYFVRASYAGTATFAGSTTSTVYTISKGNTNFQMTPNNANLVVGEELSVTVTISPRSPAGQLGGSLLPSGTVTLRLNGVVVPGGPFTLNTEGKATVSLGTLPVGTHTIDVTYNGDVNYNTVASTPASRLVVTVRKASAQFTLAPSVPTATFGEPVTFTATLNPVAPATAIPTGTVTFRRGSATGVILGTGTLDANGIATLTVSNLPVGNQTVFAIWPGDANFVAPAAVSTSVNITRVGTTTTVSSSANPSNPGASVQLRADIVAANSATPTGSVRFVNADTGAVLGTAAVNAPGRAVLNVTLPVGTYNIRAEYLGNATLAPSSATFTQVSAWGSRTTLTTSQNPSLPGSQVTITATVAKAAGVPAAVANPVGTVEFYNDSVSTTTPAFTATLNPSGQAAWVTNALPTGANNIRVVFVPSNATYASSSATLVQNVVFNSTTTLSAALNPIVTGQSNTFTASVTGGFGMPTGIVEFRVGTTVLGQATLNASGQASLTTNALVASTSPVTVTAVYLGDNTYASSQSAVNLTVNRADTTVALTSNGPSTGAGLPAIFTATVAAVAPGSRTPTGTVTFTATPTVGTPRTATVALNASGQAVWNVSNLPQGNYTVTASYSGSTAYNASADNVGIAHNVLAAATVALTSSDNPALPTVDIVLTTTVTGTAANGRPSGTVIFTINGVDQPPVTLVNGTSALQAVATLTLPAGSLPLGTATITARYSGDAVYGGRVSPTLNQAVRGNTSVSVSSSNPSAPVRTPVTLTATITQIAAPVHLPEPTGTVTFRNGTTVIGTATVNTVGGVTTASLTVNNLPIGTRLITATYNGDSNNLASTSPVFTQTIIPVVSTISIVPSTTLVPVSTPISFQVTAFGPDNNVATSFNGTGSFTVVSAPAGGVVNGARTASFTNGVGTFTGISFSRIGTYTLRFNVDGVVRDIVITVRGGGRF